MTTATYDPAHLDADTFERLATEVFEDCSACDTLAQTLRETLTRVGDKWSVLTIGLLRNGPLRFTALRKGVPGISQRMLTRTLRGLERDGLVTRTVYPEIPPRVVYALTDLGQSLLPPVIALSAWSLHNAEKIEENRAAFDGRKG
jgi:DNA-binding HxlR family transcriptional regulator